MTLSTHALAGTTVALAFRKNPVLAFIAALLSHFVLDSFPHWHYKLKSFRQMAEYPLKSSGIPLKTFYADKNLRSDFLKIGIDFVLGAVISIGAMEIFHSGYFFISLIGVIGGMLPDALQFAYSLFPDSPLRHLQKFHKLVHAKNNLDNRPLSGISEQLALGILSIVVIGIL